MFLTILINIHIDNHTIDTHINTCPLITTTFYVSVSSSSSCYCYYLHTVPCCTVLSRGSARCRVVIVWSTVAGFQTGSGKGCVCNIIHI